MIVRWIKADLERVILTRSRELEVLRIGMGLPADEEMPKDEGEVDDPLPA